MSDLTRMYQELGDTVEPGALTPPEELRHRADRRARRRALVVVAGAVIAVAGTAVVLPNLGIVNGSGPIVGTTRSVAPPDSPSPVPTTSTPTPPTPTTPSAPPTGAAAIRPPTTIPDRAFLTQPRDTVTNWPRPSPDEHKKLPDLCDRKFGSDGSIAVRRSRVYVYGNPPHDATHVPNGYIVQTITSYRDGGASAFMDQLADAVRKCGQENDGRQKIRYTLLDAPDRGDEALLIRIRGDVLDINTDEVTGTADHQVSVVRIGPVVTILHSSGWERGFETKPEVMRTFTRLATENVDDWLR